MLNCSIAETISSDVLNGDVGCNKIIVSGDSLPSFIGGKLEDGVHSVCPAMSVLDAYGVVVDEVVVVY